jgi:hypothetical protein
MYVGTERFRFFPLDSKQRIAGELMSVEYEDSSLDDKSTSKCRSSSRSSSSDTEFSEGMKEWLEEFASASNLAKSIPDAILFCGKTCFPLSPSPPTAT